MRAVQVLVNVGGPSGRYQLLRRYVFLVAVQISELGLGLATAEYSLEIVAVVPGRLLIALYRDIHVIMVDPALAVVS